MSAADDMKAWAVGIEPTGQTYPNPAAKPMMWHTTDGGLSWTRMASSGLESDGFSAIPFLKMHADGSGWMVVGNRILHTNDNGDHWSDVKMPDGLQPYYFSALPQAISSPNGNTLTAATYGQVFRTADAGVTWTAYSVKQELVNASYVLSAGALNVTGSAVFMNYAGRLYRSMDNGTTWNSVLGSDVTTPSTTFWSTWFFNARQGLALNSVGHLMETSDGGLSWITRSVIETNASDPLVGTLQFTSSSSGWMLRTRTQVTNAYGTLTNSSSIWRTIDGGKSWIAPLDSATFNQATSFHFVDAQHGWVLNQPSSSYGTQSASELYASEDGGETWTLRAKLDQPFSHIAFFDTNVGIAVGNNGAIARSTDGGRTWVKRPSRVQRNLTRVRLQADGSGWIVGQNGVLLHTVDRGQSWSLVPLLTEAYLNDILLSGNQNAWLLTSNGDVMATQDGGLTWSVQFTGYGAMLTTGSFVDSRTGWIVGSNGTILTTVTGGR